MQWQIWEKKISRESEKSTMRTYKCLWNVVWLIRLNLCFITLRARVSFVIFSFGLCYRQATYSNPISSIQVQALNENNARTTIQFVTMHNWDRLACDYFSVCCILWSSCCVDFPYGSWLTILECVTLSVNKCDEIPMSFHFSKYPTFLWSRLPLFRSTTQYEIQILNYHF